MLRRWRIDTVRVAMHKKMTQMFTACLAVAASMAAVDNAHASCRIRNETKYAFTVESGNTSNQRVGANTTTSIAAGKIRAISNEGKSFGGSCKDGDSLVVTEERGVVVMTLK